MSEIRVLDYLEPVYIKKIESIVEISNENDDVDLSCPINEEGTKYFLAFEKELLVSFICLYEYDNLEYDCIAFTLPEYRKKRYFSGLFNYVKDFLKTKMRNEEIRLNFSIYEKCIGAKRSLEKIKAIYDKSEAFMELKIYDRSYKEINMYCSNKDIDKARIYLESVEELGTYREYVIKYNNIKIGKFYFQVNEKSIYFYGFEIIKVYRNKGYAFITMNKLIEKLIQSKYENILLQVDMSNIAAYNLYLKLGFVVKQKLDMYYLVF